MEPQRRFQLFEEKFDLPAQSVPFHNLLGRQTQIIGHQDLLHFDRSVLGRFHSCREDQLHLANRVHSLSPLLYVIRTRFHFRPHAPGTDTSLLDAWALASMKPNFYQPIGLQTVDQRAHFRSFSLRTCQHAFRIQWYHPGILPFVAGLANALGVEGRVAQHHDLDPFRQRQFRNHLRRQLGLGAIGAVLGFAIFTRVVTPAKRNADAARRDQQALDETMTSLAGVLIFVVTSAFARTTLAVARAKGILRLSSLLTDQRLIDQEEERPRQPAFHHQQLATQRCGWRQPAQQFPSQKAAHLSPVPRLRSDCRGSSGRSHATEVHHEGRDTTNDQGQHPLIQTDWLEKTLESGQCILHDDHCEAPSSAWGRIRVLLNAVIYPLSQLRGSLFSVLQANPEKAQLQNAPARALLARRAKVLPIHPH